MHRFFYKNEQSTSICISALTNTDTKYLIGPLRLNVPQHVFQEYGDCHCVSLQYKYKFNEIVIYIHAYATGMGIVISSVQVEFLTLVSVPIPNFCIIPIPNTGISAKIQFLYHTDTRYWHQYKNPVLALVPIPNAGIGTNTDAGYRCQNSILVSVPIPDFGIGTNTRCWLSVSTPDAGYRYWYPMLVSVHSL